MDHGVVCVSHYFPNLNMCLRINRCESTGVYHELEYIYSIFARLSKSALLIVLRRKSCNKFSYRYAAEFAVRTQTETAKCYFDNVNAVLTSCKELLAA